VLYLDILFKFTNIKFYLALKPSFEVNVNLKKLLPYQKVDLTENSYTTVCRICGEDCGIVLYVDSEGNITDVSGVVNNPGNRGDICLKARSINEYLKSPNRLRYPLIREGEFWRRSSWEEALSLIATKLKEIKERGEERAVAIFQGYGVGHYEIKWFMQRFADLYGTPNFCSAASLCFIARPIGHRLTVGALIVPRFEESKCMIVWGANPYASSYPRWCKRIIEARERGAKLILIDPLPNYFSDKADLLLQPLPGTDLALALGFMNVIIEEGLYDEVFVQRWTVGFDKLKAHVAEYTPKIVEKITTVPKEMIKQAAEAYATIKPACIHTGVGLEHSLNAVQTCQAIAMLPALTGNLDVPGGNIMGTRLPTTFMRFPERVKGQPLGSSKYPLWYEIERSAHLRDVLTAMLEGKPYRIRVLIVAGSNPILTWPDTRKVLRALKELELFVVIDPFFTESARLAHVVLPAATFLERYEHSGHLGAYIAPYIALRREVFPPAGESKPDIAIWAELAKKLEMQEYFPWEDIKEAIQAIIAPSGITVKQLEEKLEGLYYGRKTYKVYEKEGFNTPSKKVEFYSEQLKKLGYDALPTYKKREKLLEYPLILVTGYRYQEYVHSQLREIHSLRKRVPECLVYINTNTAKSYGIQDGDLVNVETEKGSIKAKAQLSIYAHPRVIGVSHGWIEANVNLLTSWEDADPLSGFPNLKTIPCKISKSQ